MIKYKNILILTMLLSLATPIYAQSGNANQNQQIPSKVQERVQLRVENEEEKGIQREETIRNILRNQTRKASSRLEATIERLEKIMARIVSRTEKIKNAGGNTTDAEKFIAEAKTHLSEARLELAKLKTASDTTISTVSSTTPMSKELQKLKAISKIIHEHIVEAHKSLTKALGNLKGQSQTAPNASSTTTN